MKIRKRELRQRLSSDRFPEHRLENALYPLVPNVLSKSLQVYFCRKSEFKGEIQLDWARYELIVFNLLQNAIKYNQFMGAVVVIVDVYRSMQLEADQFMFETTIIDTGEGIAADRHKFLFRPFEELKVK